MSFARPILFMFFSATMIGCSSTGAKEQAGLNTSPSTLVLLGDVPRSGSGCSLRDGVTITFCVVGLLSR